MAFSDLQSKLRPWSTGGPTPPGPLVLDAALVGSDSVVAMWSSTLGAKAITINQPRVSLNGSQIVVGGTASLLNINDLPVEAVFEDANQQLKFRLTASLPDAWTFGQSFPDLPPSYSFDPRNYGYSESYLQLLGFSQPFFVLTTHAYTDAGSGAAFEKGLNFGGQVAPAGPLAGIDLLTGSKNAVRVSGLIASDTPTPEFCLTAEIPLRLGDNPVAKKLKNVRLKLWSGLSSKSRTAPRIEASLQLEPFTGKFVEVYCPLRIGAPLDFVVIGGRFTNLDLPSLGDIAQLVGGSDLENQLPKELRKFGGLTIREVRTGVSLAGPDIGYVQVSIRTTTPWTVISKVFEIDSICAAWLIESPFKSEDRRISCELEGRLLIGDVPLDLFAQYPGFRMSASLAEGSTIKLGALIKHLSPSSPLPDDSLVISTLALGIDPDAKTYEVEAQVDEVWSIPLGSAQLGIKSIAVSLTKTTERLTGILAGVLELRLPIDGTEHRVTLKLTAALPASATDGWQFTGSTGQGQKIPIGALIAMLAKMCGAVEVPKAVEKFTIENLRISFNTATKKFTFGCEGRLPLIEGKPPIEARIDILIDQQRSEKKIAGQLVVYPKEGERLQFDLKFESGPKAQTFLATYYEEGGRKVSIDALLEQLFSAPVSTGIELTLKDAVFAYRGDGAARYLFGLNIGFDIGLDKLPVVGPALPAGLKVGVENLQVLAANAPFTVPELTSLNLLMPEKMSKLPAAKTNGSDTALKKGLNVSANLKLGGTSKQLMLPASSEAPASGDGAASTPAVTTDPPPTPPATKPPAGISKWFDIQKNVGPLRLQRLGVQWKDQRLGFLFDAGIDLLGVRLDLLGLNINLPLSNPQFKDVKFELDGLELSVKQKPLEISGALLRVYPTDDKISLQYDGRVLVRAEVFSLAALGSYAVINDQPSLFIFAVLHKELGGPAFFFVTGLAFGFGVNRLLKLPTIEEVHNFPLIKGATDPDYFGSAATPRTALAKLQEYIPPSVGDYWLAAGVKFNSFGMIDSFAVLSVSFGTQFQLAILGLSRITVPRQLPGVAAIEPIACAELALKVSFTLSSGLLAAEARLTENSFVLSKDCKLRGGFALYCWLGPDHAGDFVVTLGGYHPKFTRPSHYPIVPRLGMNWKVGENLALCGELYFALTPSCLMAGGKLSAAFQAGPVRAWFYASCDFLINWQPFAYDIAVVIRIGVAFVLGSGDASQALTIEIGAQLHLWGPPFGGIATINLYIISFDIVFGESQQPVLEKVDWKPFHQSFLPQAPEADADPLLGSIRITAGLIKAQEVSKNGQKTKLNVVNAHELQFVTESVVPATSVLLNNKAVETAGVAPKAVGIRPMDIKSLTSVHAVTVVPKSTLPAEWDAHLAPSLTTKSVPQALWNNSGLTRLERPSADMVEAALNGSSVSLRHREPSHGLPPIDLQKFKYDRIPKDIHWQEWKSPALIPSPGDNTLANTIWGNDTVNATREAILKALGKDPAKISLSNLATESAEIFQSDPDMARLGEPFKQNLYAG